MSTDYYILCDYHRQCCSAVTLYASGVDSRGPSFVLGQFLFDHHKCQIRIVDENQDEVYDYNEPYEDAPDLLWEKETKLLERASKAEMEVRKLRKLYGSPI